MSIRRRISRIIRANRSASRQPDQDPVQAVEAAHRQQVDLLDQARRSVADLAANRRRLEILTEEATAGLDRLNREAEQAVANGNDDGARAALQRAIPARRRVEMLTSQRRDLDAQVGQLEANLQRLESRVEENALHHQALKARQGAARAALGMQDALDSSGRASAGAASAAREAESEARRLQATAAAHEELAWTDPHSRRMEEALEELEISAAAEDELSQLKARKEPTER